MPIEKEQPQPAERSHPIGRNQHSPRSRQAVADQAGGEGRAAGTYPTGYIRAEGREQGEFCGHYKKEQATQSGNKGGPFTVSAKAQRMTALLFYHRAAADASRKARQGGKDKRS